VKLGGKTAIVTGASGGVGRGIALALGEAGCNVAVNYLDDRAGAEETVEALRMSGVETVTAVAIQADVGSSADVQRMFDSVLEHFLQIDILVNNAGVQVWGPLLDATEEDWDLVIRTNLKGCFLCAQRAARHMRERGQGVIVNIGSGSNKLPFPNLAAYTASKGGIEMFTKAAAVELGRYGIRVNCVAPGAIEIDRTKREAANFSDAWAKITPLGRVGLPRDVGSAVVYLATEEAAFISGQTIWVDGAAFTQPRWPHDGYEG
jgi:NAD(P)-dependent dehydrogenase (short-subunit alcohol dehydrogenase family)